MTHSAAFKKAYSKPRWNARQAADGAKDKISRPGVREYIASLRQRSEARTLLTLNDRLELLAQSARFKPKNAADRNAQARVIEVYSKISGDQAPERTETIIKGDPTAPVEVQVTRVTRAQKAAQMLASIKAAKAPQAPPPPPAAP